LFTQVAIICNHQRSVSKSHDSQMTRLNEKIDELKVEFLLQMISPTLYHFILLSFSGKLSCFFSFLQAQRDELKADLSKVRKGKNLGNDKDGKPKRNLAPEA
jgi:DNA topoisomerase-1